MVVTFEVLQRGPENTWPLSVTSVGKPDSPSAWPRRSIAPSSPCATARAAPGVPSCQVVSL
jgi:hypothetical protein